MKKTLYTLAYILCAMATLFIVSCSKSGDAGPAGPAGPAGAAGAAGAAGPAGATGTANVIYSTWIDTATWIPDITQAGDTVGFFADIKATKLNADMLNKGEIKVYVNAGDANDPFIFPLPYNNGGLFIDVSFFLNTIELYSNGDLTDVPFRYVLIPGGNPARSANSIDWNDYKAVQKYLGLTD